STLAANSSLSDGGRSRRLLLRRARWRRRLASTPAFAASRGHSAPTRTATAQASRTTNSQLTTGDSTGLNRWASGAEKRGHGRAAFGSRHLRPPVPRPLGGARPRAPREGEHRPAHVRSLRPHLRAPHARRARLSLRAGELVAAAPQFGW